MKFRSRQRGEYVSLLEMFRKVQEHSQSIEVLMSRRVNDHCFSLFFSLFLVLIAEGTTFLCSLPPWIVSNAYVHAFARPPLGEIR